MNPIWDALGTVGHVLDTPGAYLRGALAGRPGERSSGESLLSSYGVQGGPWGGLAAEMVLDPLAIAGPALGAVKGVQGINRATQGARALAQADDVNPLLRSAARLVGDEEGAAKVLGLPYAEADEMFRSSGPATPLGWLGQLSGAAGTTVQLPESVAHFEDLYRGIAKNHAMAVYDPTTRRIIPNTHEYPKHWASLGKMSDRYVTPDYVPLHEIGHSLHDDALRAASPVRGEHDMVIMGATDYREAGSQDWGRLRDEVDARFGANAASRPIEFVADYFADQAGGAATRSLHPGFGAGSVDPRIRAYYAKLRGPDAPNALLEALKQLRQAW